VYPRRDSPAERLPSDANNRQGAPEKYQTKNSSAGESKMDLMVEAAAAASTKEESKSKNFDLTRYDEQENVRTMNLPTGESILLLALPQDRVALSETLCVVREVSCCCFAVAITNCERNLQYRKKILAEY